MLTACGAGAQPQGDALELELISLTPRQVWCCCAGFHWSLFSLHTLKQFWSLSWCQKEKNGNLTEFVRAKMKLADLVRASKAELETSRSAEKQAVTSGLVLKGRDR